MDLNQKFMKQEKKPNIIVNENKTKPSLSKYFMEKFIFLLKQSDSYKTQKKHSCGNL